MALKLKSITIILIKSQFYFEEKKLKPNYWTHQYNISRFIECKIKNLLFIYLNQDLKYKQTLNEIYKIARWNKSILKE